MEQSDKKDELPQPKIFMTCIGVGGLLVQFQVEALDKQKAGDAIKAASKVMARAVYIAVEEMPDVIVGSILESAEKRGHEVVTR